MKKILLVLIIVIFVILFIMLLINLLKKDNNEDDNEDMINSVLEFKEKYKTGIIVNYDKRITYRCKTDNCEQLAKNIEYPYIQPYQTGVKPTTTLFIIKDNKMYELKRVNETDKNSNYKKYIVKDKLSKDFYNDKVFDTEGKVPVVINESILKIIN